MIDIQTLVIVGGLIVNAVAVFWNIIETSKLHKQTKELQESNAKLQSEVNRLSVHLNQEITRLNRLNELTRGMYLSSARLNHKYMLMKTVGVGEVIKSKMGNVSVDEFADFLITFKGSIIEMRAIANVIGDPELQSLVEQIHSNVPVDAMKEPELSRESLNKFEKSATDLLEKIYSLLQAATEAA